MAWPCAKCFQECFSKENIIIHSLNTAIPNHFMFWLRVRLVHCLTGLSPPVKYLTDRSKAVPLLWIFMFFLSGVCYAFVRVCLYVPCGHLLGKG